MLTTASMVRLGHVFDNLMVNVQPTNRKLRERARRVVAEVTGAGAAEAAALLESAGGSIKAAIVMHQLGVDRSEADSLLANSGGQIAIALENRGPRR